VRRKTHAAVVERVCCRFGPHGSRDAHGLPHTSGEVLVFSLTGTPRSQSDNTSTSNHHCMQNALDRKVYSSHQATNTLPPPRSQVLVSPPTDHSGPHTLTLPTAGNRSLAREKARPANHDHPGPHVQQCAAERARPVRKKVPSSANGRFCILTTHSLSSKQRLPNPRSPQPPPREPPPTPRNGGGTSLIPLRRPSNPLLRAALPTHLEPSHTTSTTTTKTATPQPSFLVLIISTDNVRARINTAVTSRTTPPTVRAARSTHQRSLICHVAVPARLQPRRRSGQEGADGGLDA
jgi:hypothetical protein